MTARRALIIRSGYDPVAGVHNAADCIGQVLRTRGFELVLCEGPAATRRGILAAYDDLIARAQPDDAIVIYYAGHGGRATNDSYTPGSQLPPCVQHICPTDFAETRDGDFRGICALELSLKLAALTRRTANATVILECCYAAQMSRAATDDPALVVQPTLTRVGLTRHLEEVRALARSLDVQPGAVNPRAVRVAAAGQAELARQVSLPSDEALGALGITLSRHGEWIGALTLGLVQILAEIGDARVPWRSIAPALRARLLVQRPEIEGPIGRVPFSLTTVDDAAYAVRRDGDGAILEAGRLLGVSVGDVYHVVPAGASTDDPDALVATLTIDEVSATRGRASRIAWASAHRELPGTAIAIAASLAPERHPVRIVAPDSAREAVLEAVNGSPGLRAATEADGPDVLGELHVSGDQLELRDRLGPLFPPAPYPDRLADAVLDLANLATEQRLRLLAEDGGIAPSAMAVELGRIGPTGAFLPIARHGEPMGLADSLAVRLENTTDAPLYANVFNIGLQRRIALLSADWASGALVKRGTPVYVGDRTHDELRGFQLAWPAGLARDRPRRDTVMVVITTEPADLRALESGSYLQPRAAQSPLQALLAQLAPGTPRGGLTSARYAIVWRDYLLFPIDGPLDPGIPEVGRSPVG
ncbi:MAG TPA: caspase family protein [Kofleriaceae bacterium]|nr:caspase family protein [Kofleriaceae bacterium]